VTSRARGATQWVFRACRQAAGVLLATVICVSSSTPAGAEIVLDQQLHPRGGWLQNPGFCSGHTWSFSFTPLHGNVAGTGIWLSRWTSAPMDLTYTLLDDVPGRGTVLASAVISVTEDGYPNGPASDAFWTPVPVTAGRTYFIQFAGPCEYLPGQYFHYTYISLRDPDSANLYYDGAKFASGWPPSEWKYWSIDYEIYYDDSVPTATRPMTWGRIKALYR